MPRKKTLKQSVWNTGRKIRAMKHKKYTTMAIGSMSDHVGRTKKYKKPKKKSKGSRHFEEESEE